MIALSLTGLATAYAHAWLAHAATIHFFLFCLLGVMTAIHIGLALWHHFLKNDVTPVRILGREADPAAQALAGLKPSVRSASNP